MLNSWTHLFSQRRVHVWFQDWGFDCDSFRTSLECGLSVWIIRSNYSIPSIGRVALCSSRVLCLEGYWGMEKPSALSSRNLFFGAILAICAFIWDFETNIATGLLALWPRENLLGVLIFEVTGIPFMITHELSDFILGVTCSDHHHIQPVADGKS